MGGSPYGVSSWLDGTWEDGIPRVTSGVLGRADRLKQLGNAVVPPVVEVIGRFIMEIENGT
jgi:site-specific DNA-cytosine methylase